MTDRTFDPGFRIALNRKYVNIALESVRSLIPSLPVSAPVQELSKAYTAQGFGDFDHSALIRALEARAAHKIRDWGRATARLAKAAERTLP